MSQPAFGALGRLVRERAPEELCELCGARLREEHRHLFDPASRQVLCGCDACAILFSRSDSETRYHTIPQRIRRLADVEIPNELWDSLGLPVNMAFFQRQAATGKVVAYYPSPGGPTQSSLQLDAWEDFEREFPVLLEMEPDVEALLVNRVARGGEIYLAPIDECFKLVGLIRLSWKGISGGMELWKEVGDFFTDLARRAEPVRVANGA